MSVSGGEMESVKEGGAKLKRGRREVGRVVLERKRDERWRGCGKEGEEKREVGFEGKWEGWKECEKGGGGKVRRGVKEK